MKKKQITRKRRAIRWMTGFCLLLLLCSAGGTYGLRKESALRKQERYLFVDPTSIVSSVRDRYEQIPGKGYVLASENEDILMLGLVRWRFWTGWQPGFAWMTERNHAPVDAVHAWYSWDPHAGVYPYLVFGAVNDARIRTIELSFRDWEAGETQTVELEVSMGTPYFTELLEAPNICRIHLTARDAEGTVIYEESLENGISLGHYDWDL